MISYTSPGVDTGFIIYLLSELSDLIRISPATDLLVERRSLLPRVLFYCCCYCSWWMIAEAMIGPPKSSFVTSPGLVWLLTLVVLRIISSDLVGCGYFSIDFFFIVFLVHFDANGRFKTFLPLAKARGVSCWATDWLYLTRLSLKIWDSSCPFTLMVLPCSGKSARRGIISWIWSALVWSFRLTRDGSF